MEPPHGKRFTLLHATGLPELKTIRAVEVGPSSLLIDLLLTEPALYNMTLNISAANDWVLYERTKLLMIQAAVNEPDEIPSGAPTLCHLLPPQQLVLFTEGSSMPSPDCVWISDTERGTEVLQADRRYGVQTRMYHLMPGATYNVYFSGWEHLRPWEPITAPERTPTLETAGDARAELEKVEINIYATCPPGSKGHKAATDSTGVGAGAAPVVPPEFVCPYGYQPGWVCYKVLTEYRYLVDALGQPLTAKFGLIDPALDNVNYLEKFTLPVNYFLEACLGGLPPLPGDELFFVFDLSRISPVSPWAKYVMVNDNRRENNQAYLDSLRYADFAQVKTSAHFLHSYTTVTADVADRYKGSTRLFTFRIDSFDERKRQLVEEIVQDPNFSLRFRSPQPDYTFIPENAMVYQLQLDTTYFNFWVTNVYTSYKPDGGAPPPQDGYSGFSESTLPAMTANCQSVFDERSTNYELSFFPFLILCRGLEKISPLPFSHPPIFPSPPPTPPSTPPPSPPPHDTSPPTPLEPVD